MWPTNSKVGLPKTFSTHVLTQPALDVQHSATGVNIYPAGFCLALVQFLAIISSYLLGWECLPCVLVFWGCLAFFFDIYRASHIRIWLEFQRFWILNFYSAGIVKNLATPRDEFLHYSCLCIDGAEGILSSENMLLGTIEFISLLVFTFGISTTARPLGLCCLKLRFVEST